jgi:hypothetical protein
MKRLFLTTVLAVLFFGCVPNETQDYELPITAGKFAQMQFQANKLSVGGSLLKTLESIVGGFILKGTNKDKSVFATFWVKLAGQSAFVYFVIEGNEKITVVRVLTSPTPPPTTELLIQSLTILGQAIQESLNLTDFQLEPDH